MKIEGNAEITVFEFLEKFTVIGKQVRIPAVSGPSAAFDTEFFFDFDPVPVHINRCDCQRNIFRGKPVHKRKIFFIGICVISAPPHTESKSRNKRSRRAYHIKGTHCLSVIFAVSKNIEVPAAFSRFETAVFIYQKAFAVVIKESAFCRDKPFFKMNVISFPVKSSRRAFKVFLLTENKLLDFFLFSGFAVFCFFRLFLLISAALQYHAVRHAFFYYKKYVLCLNIQLIAVFFRLHLPCRESAVPHGIARLIIKSAGLNPEKL